MKRLRVWIIVGVILGFILPGVALAGGDKASELIVVADTRVLTEGGYYTQFMHYMADAYNANILVFAIWCTVLTAVYGALLGFLMDFLMSRTGLDLKSRKILEH
jgi:ABC-type Fe3+ transport system permease subunit